MAWPDNHDMEWDNLPGTFGDETEVVFNNRMGTTMLVQRYSGDHATSVTLDKDQALDLLFKLAEKFDLTLS